MNKNYIGPKNCLCEIALNFTASFTKQNIWTCLYGMGKLLIPGVEKSLG